MVLRAAKIAFLCVAITYCVVAQSTEIFKFSEFKTPIIRWHKSVKTKILSEKDRRCKTILEQASLKNPDFAGHYVVVAVGCGSSCVMAAAIDTESGRVSWLPFSVSEGPNAPLSWQPLAYKADSSLLIVTGARNESGNGRYFYNFKNGLFQLLKSD